MKIGKLVPWVAGLLVIVAAWLWLLGVRKPGAADQRTVKERLREFGAAASHRLAPHFEQAGVPYPPAGFDLVAFKQERRLELHAKDSHGHRRLIRSYPVLGASGSGGPKLREGDLQVPEGLYSIELLNPNSRFHVSMRLNYPNEDDIAQAHRDGRDPAGLGGDIMIHGGAASVGCIAIGDEAVEEIFVLAALTGHEKIRVLIVPWDLRFQSSGDLHRDAPSWTANLHERLRKALTDFPR